MIFNIGGYENAKGKMPEFTYSAGGYSLTDEGKSGSEQNWSLRLTQSGVLNFNKVVKKIDVFILGAGGAGATTGNSTGGAPGGGGYYQILTGIDVSKNSSYNIIVGTGGDSIGEPGGYSSAFGSTANGGGCATAGTMNAVTCTCKCRQGGSSVIRYATTSDGNGWSYMSSDEESIKLKYPAQEIEIRVSGQRAITYQGADGYYYYVTIQSYDQYHYSNGTAGTGGSSTKVFGTGEAVSGKGGTSAASLKGQGGGSNNIVAGNGLVVIRNAR